MIDAVKRQAFLDDLAALTRKHRLAVVWSEADRIATAPVVEQTEADDDGGEYRLHLLKHPRQHESRWRLRFHTASEMQAVRWCDTHGVRFDKVREWKNSDGAYVMLYFRDMNGKYQIIDAWTPTSSMEDAIWCWDK